ncbi:MAG: hypothetical protein U1G07_08855 [Verrucomicrobiota bacterium]
MNAHLKDASATVADIELSDLDLRYQSHRLQQPRLEEQLLSSIAQLGIQEPLQGVRTDGGGDPAQRV